MSSDTIQLKNETYSVYADTRCVVGEGPIWSAEENAFYWVDLTSGNVYRKFDDNFSRFNHFEMFELNVGKIGGIVHTRSGDFLLFAQYGVVYRWKPNSKPIEFARLKEASDLRFNDIVVAPDGNILCTVAPNSEGIGQLWLFDSSKNFKLVDATLKGMPNGMGFSPDNKIFYLTVSDERVIYKFDYADGFPKNKSVFVHIPSEVKGIPDGMAVDVVGNIWSANWNGFELTKYAPNGEKIGSIKFPIKKITSLVFGGKNLNKVLVTTANYPWVESDYIDFKSGNVFEIFSEIAGLPKYDANF